MAGISFGLLLVYLNSNVAFAQGDLAAALEQSRAEQMKTLFIAIGITISIVAAILFLYFRKRKKQTALK